MHLSIIIEYHPIFLRKIQEVMPSRDSTKYTVTLEIVVPYYAEPSEVMTLNFFLCCLGTGTILVSGTGTGTGYVIFKKIKVRVRL
jgi:hypothetical protein